jgi:hypothetical protein
MLVTFGSLRERVDFIISLDLKLGTIGHKHFYVHISTISPVKVTRYTVLILSSIKLGMGVGMAQPV